MKSCPVFFMRFEVSRLPAFQCDIADVRSIEMEHEQAINAKCHTGAIGQALRKGVEKASVKRHDGQSQVLALAIVSKETFALLIGIRQFPEAVAKFHAAIIKLETRGYCMAVCILVQAGEGSLRGRIVKDEFEAVRAQLRFDEMGEKEVEHAVAIKCPLCAFRQFLRAETAQGIIVKHCDVVSEMAGECGAVRRMLHGQFAGVRQQDVHEFGDFLHEAVMIKLCAIPFEHHEFTLMLAPLFFAAKDVRQLVNIARTGSEQALHRIFGRGLQEALLWHRQADKMRIGDAKGTQMRGIDFEHITRGKEGTDGGEKGGAFADALTHLLLAGV